MIQHERGEIETRGDASMENMFEEEYLTIGRQVQ